MGDSGGRESRLLSETRTVAAVVLLVIGTILFMAGVVSWSVYDTVYNANHFAGTAVKAIQQPAVKTEIRDTLVSQIIAQRQDLIAAKPLIETVVDTVIGSKPFQKILTTALLEAHRTFFTTDKPSLVLDVSDGTTIILSAIQAFDPSLAANIPLGVHAGLLKLSQRPYAAQIVSIGKTVEEITFALGIVGTLLLVGSIVLAVNRRRALAALGIALAFGALLVWLVLTIGRQVLVDQFEEFASAQAVSAVYDIAFQELYTWLKVLGIAGIIVAAVMSATVHVGSARSQAEMMRRFLTRTPNAHWTRIVYAVGVVIVGALIFAFPSVMLALAARLVGLLAVYLGLTELVRLAGLASAPVTEPAGRRRGSRVRFNARPLALAALVGCVAVGGVFVWSNRDALRSEELVSASDANTCNGFKELCDRRLNEVVFPATHNSMSAANEPGWFNAEHTGGIIDQLDFGIRALLIDAHYGYPGDGGVTSDTSDPAVQKIVEAGLDQETIDAARRIAERRVTGVKAGTKRQVYLCHGFCELGATPLDTALGEISDWLGANPNEVIILFFEDYVSPEDMDAAFKRTGLIDEVYTHTSGTPFPTLREMIKNDERVFVLSENVGAKPKPVWYHDGFSLVQETPYAFKTPADMNCAPNRGTPDNPLFQINHWIEGIPPSPGNAEIVNQYDFLLARARRCQQERGRLPNWIAVDFYETGDILGVVNTLNGVGSPPSERKPSGGLPRGPGDPVAFAAVRIMRGRISP